MADTCVATPTQTRTDVGTSQSQVVTSSVSTSTAPASVETTVFRTCSVNASAGVTTTCIPTVSTSYITHPGSTTVVTVPVTVQVDYPVTNVVTLWGSSCSSVYSQPVYTPPSDTITSTWSVYTPPPTIVTSSSTVTTDGSTFIGFFTSTSTSAPTSVPVQQTGAADNGVHQKKANNIGPIVGGVVGGLVALLLLAFVTWKLISKQQRFDDIFNNDHNKIAPDPDPKPYDYGLVGQQATDPTTMSPQMNPQGLDGQGVSDFGPQPSQAPPHHLRNPSLTPLLAAVGVAAVGAGAASYSSSSRPSTSRPSTSTSDSQLTGPIVTQAGQGQAQGYPPSSFPALQNWGPSQPYGAANTQGVYNAQGFASSSGQASGSVPTSSLAPNTSVGSSGSVPSTTSSWGGAGSSTAGSSTGPHMPPIIPIIAGSARNNRQQQYEDPFNRTGSPVSIQEQRILQVTNAGPSSPQNRGSIYDPNAYYAEGSSSSSSTGYDPYAASSSSSAAYNPFAAGSSSARPGPSSLPTPPEGASSAAAFVMDGKGRPLNTKGEKMPLVHLDGGLYQQPSPGVPSAGAPTGPAPPAYTE